MVERTVDTTLYTLSEAVHSIFHLGRKPFPYLFNDIKIQCQKLYVKSA